MRVLAKDDAAKINAGAASGGRAPKLVLLCFAVWLHAASSMLAATTMPSAVRDFGGANLIGWAFSLYLLGAVLAGASTGTLMRSAGMRLGLIMASAVYFTGSLICTAAPGMEILLLGRLIQGVGGGFLVALAYVALRRWFAPQVQPKVMALVSAVWSASAFAGPLVGGTFATYGNWRMAYGAAALQAALFVVLAWVAAPPMKPAHSDSRPVIPVWRLTLISGAVLAVSFAGAAIDPVRSPVLVALGIALFWWALRVDAGPVAVRMFPSHPFDMRTPLGAGLVLVLMAAFSSVSFMVYGPILLEMLHGVTPLAAGYIVALESVGWGMAAVTVARLRRPNEVVLIRTGTILLPVTLIAFSLVLPVAPVWLVALLALAQGAAFGMMWAYVIRRINDNALHEEADAASSAVPTLQQIGFATGAAAAGIVANTLGFGDAPSMEVVAAVTTWVFAGFVPFALIAALAGWRLTR